MSRAQFIFSTLFLAASCSPVWCQMYTPVTDLGRNADLVVFGTVDKVISPGGRDAKDISVELVISNALKGNPASTSVFAHAPAWTPGAIAPIYFGPDAIGKAGVWFLKLGNSGYEILPRNRRPDAPQDLFLPLPATTLKTQGTIDEQLLAYQVAWYQSIDNPNWLDDAKFLSSFEQWNAESPSPSQIMAAIEPILKSSSGAHRIIGLTAALRAGSADAVAITADEIDTLRSNKKFGEILTALSWYQRKDVSWLPALRRVIQMRTDVPGLDAAAAGALAKIRSKEVLPLMIDLLDSKDPQVLVAVASYLGRYAIFADANGDIRDSGPVGPFYTPDIKIFSPRPDTSTVPQQYAEFWKNWWAQNQAKIMATTPAQ